MDNQVIFDPKTIEFVTVAAEFCGFMEQVRQNNFKNFIETSLMLLPTLYLKVSSLPECELLGESNPETFVTEDDYMFVKKSVAELLGSKDDYLEVFVSDMQYSDTPIKKNISEDLADIYQDLKDFIGVFQLGLNITMNDALYICKEHFAEYWGQRLVNTMRALHDIKYNNTNNYDEDDEQLGDIDDEIKDYV